MAFEKLIEELENNNKAEKQYSVSELAKYLEKF